MSRPISLTGITLGLIKGFGNFHTALFQFDLYQWQAIDQKCDIEATGAPIMITVVDGDLIGDLIDIFAWVIWQEKDVFTAAVIKFDWEQIAQFFSPFKYRSGTQEAADLFPFAVRQWS